MSTPTAVTQAAEYYLLHQPIMDAISKELEEAKKVLKEHFAKTGKTSLRGIGYTTQTATRLDVGAARLLLGPKKVAACTVPVTRALLSLPAHLRKGVILMDVSA